MPPNSRSRPLIIGSCALLAECGFAGLQKRADASDDLSEVALMKSAFKEGGPLSDPAWRAASSRR